MTGMTNNTLRRYTAEDKQVRYATWRDKLAGSKKDHVVTSVVQTELSITLGGFDLSFKNKKSMESRDHDASMTSVQKVKQQEMHQKT